MDNTNNTTNKIFRSDEAIDIVLSTLGLTRESLSTYKEYALENGIYIRLRVSDHGIFLQNWFEANKEKRALSPTVPKLNCFPAKIKNVTKAKTANGNNVKPQFSIRHICYYTWLLCLDDINIISSSLLNCVTNGSCFDEPLKDNNKYVEWKDTSNLPPSRIQGISTLIPSPNPK